MLKEKVESIDKMIEEWERQRSASARHFEDIKESRLDEYSRVWMDYLADDFPFENTYIRMHNERVEIHRDVDDRNRRELITVGAVANVLLNHYDDILAALNTAKSEWAERYNSAFTDLRKADSMIHNW